MLPKKWRLVKDQEIKKTYFTKFQAKSKFSQIYFRKTTNLNFQLLVVVSKKIYKKANKRNRIRRKIESIFEDLKFQNRLPPRSACIVQVKNKEILFQSQEEIKEDVIPEISKLYSKSNTYIKNK